MFKSEKAKITRSFLNKELKHLIAPEVIEDYRLFNLIFSNQVINNYRDLSPNDMKFIAQSYNILNRLKRYQTNKLKNMIYKKEHLHSVLPSFHIPIDNMVNSYKKFFELYAGSSITTQWLSTIPFVGPVSIFFIMAYGGQYIINNRYKTAGGLWRYYGLDPEMSTKEKSKQYIRINPGIRDSFYYIRSRMRAGKMGIYSDLYKLRLDFEIKRNQEGGNLPYLLSKKEKFILYRTVPDFIESMLVKGELPYKHLRSRAEKYALKVLLAHFHHVLYYESHGRLPPFPYYLDCLGERFLKNQIPNWPF